MSQDSKQEASPKTDYVVIGKSGNIKNVEGPFMIQEVDNKTPDEPIKFSSGAIFLTEDRKSVTFWEACRQAPYVPIGALATAGVLIMGVRSVTKKDSVKSQFWMRMRIVAQALTFAGIIFSINLLGDRKSPTAYVTKYDSSVKGFAPNTNAKSSSSSSSSSNEKN
jgi:hypothetical protein